MKRRNKYLHLWMLAILPAIFFSCTKMKVEPVDTYPDPPKALVKFLDGLPSPSLGNEGSVVTFNVTGLKGKEGKFTFFINQTPAEVVSVDSASIKVKVPPNASTGGASVLINEEFYFGPTFVVKGKVSIDPLFNPEANRSNGAIAGIFKNSNGNYVAYGSFSNYANQANATNVITGLAVLDENGKYLAIANQLKIGKGMNGFVTSLIQLPDNNYLVAGSFSSFDFVKNISNITRINADGTLETQVVNVINPDPVKNPNADKDTVPIFNGGVGGPVTKAFYDENTETVTAIGNFPFYVSSFYERSVRGGPYLDYAKISQLVRMNYDGSLDSSFNYNRATNSGYEAGNGFITDALQLDDGKILIVGNFTSFDGKPVNHIVRLNDDGKADPTFNAGGSGADGNVYKATYNSNTEKILLTGDFKKYNGQPANGIVIINTNGSIDASFKFRETEGGFPNFAGQLDNGKIIVSGTFNKYDKIVRPGLLILNTDGSLAAGYNTTGLFRGAIMSMLELSSISGVPQVILTGSFDRFDGKEVGNIVKFRIEN